jgi:hydrogenase-4 component E
MENALIVLFGFTMLYMSATSRIKAQIKMLSIQGLILFLICYFIIQQTNPIVFGFLAVETLIVKMIIVPGFLFKVLKKNISYSFEEFNKSNFYSLVISSGILFVGLMLSNIDNDAFQNVNTTLFGISFSVIILSLFLITTRKNILTSVINYIMMENGIFLLSLSVSKEMPMIINMGILLDIFIAIFILGLFINRINEAECAPNLSKISKLKGNQNDN